jgi:hypothetical protein
MAKQCTQCGLKKSQTFEPFFETKQFGTLCAICIDFADEHAEKLEQTTTQRFKVKDAPAWTTKPVRNQKNIPAWVYDRTKQTAKRISSERELRRLQWNL